MTWAVTEKHYKHFSFLSRRLITNVFQLKVYEPHMDELLYLTVHYLHIRLYWNWSQMFRFLKPDTILWISTWIKTHIVQMKTVHPFAVTHPISSSTSQKKLNPYRA